MKKIATALVVLAALCSLSLSASANSVYQTLPFSQDWSVDLITVTNDMSLVPGIDAFLGDVTATFATGQDPQTILTDPATMFATATPWVAANVSSAIATYTTGGPVEFLAANIPNPVGDATIAMQGSGTADAPNLIIYIDASFKENIRLQYDLRDIDAQAFTAIVQPFAAQYRLGSTGAFTNIPAAFVANACDGLTGSAVKLTHVDVTLPAAVNGASQLQIRIITTNAVSNDEEIGIDNISVTGTDMPVPTVRSTWGSIKSLYR